jgi:Mg/Co/Ni transporter MgtE
VLGKFLSLRKGAGWSFILFAMMFAIGLVAATMHKTLSFRDLVSGRPGIAVAAQLLDLAKISHEDFRAVSKSCFRVGLILGVIVAALVGQRHGWLLLTVLGLGTWWLGSLVISALFSLIARQYIVGRICYIHWGLVLFWTGAIAVVVPIVIVFITFSA